MNEWMDLACESESWGFIYLNKIVVSDSVPPSSIVIVIFALFGLFGLFVIVPSTNLNAALWLLPQA